MKPSAHGSVGATLLLRPDAASPKRVLVGAQVGSGAFATVVAISPLRVLRLTHGTPALLRRELRGLRIAQRLHALGAAVPRVWGLGRYALDADAGGSAGVYGELERFDVDLFDYLDKQDRLRRSGRSEGPSVADFLSFADRMLRTVGAVHTLGWIHNDVKPENVGLLVRHGRARLDTCVLFDFGHATRIVAASRNGTRAFLPPEAIARAAFPVGYDPRAKEAFSVGKTLLLVWYAVVPPPPTSWHFGAETTFLAGRRDRAQHLEGRSRGIESDLLRLTDPDWAKRPSLACTQKTLLTRV